MKTFFTCLKRDLLQFIKSPITYICFVVLLFYFLFFGLTTNITNNFLFYIPLIFIIIIPTLTMQLWRYEKDIVATLPIKKIILIYSKIFSTYIVCFLFLLFPFILCIVNRVEISIIGVSFLILNLYLLSAISFCSFVSLKTKNIAISFFVSTIALVLSCSLHSIAISFNLPINILKLCNYFSFNYHFNAASKGILDTRDFIFYILIFSFFVILSLLNFYKQKKYKLLILTIILILLNSTKYFLVTDFTTSKKYSLSDYSKKIISSIENTVYLTWYKSNNIENYIPELRNVEDFLFSYVDKSSNIVFNIKDVNNKSEEIKVLENFGVYPQRLQSNKKNKSTTIEIISAIILEYENKAEVIPFVLNCNTLEYDIAIRLEYFATNKYNAVQIFCGNGLEIKKDYPYLITCLDTLGFKCIEIKNTYEILHSVPLLLLGCTTLTEEDCINIENFILDNGNGYFAVSPFDVDIYGDWKITKKEDNYFINLLNNYGIIIEDKIVLDENCFTLTMQSTQKDLPQYIDYYFWINSKNTVGFWVSPLNIKNKNYESILTTSNKSWTISSNNKSIDGSPFIAESYQNKLQNKTYDFGIKIDDKFDGFYSATKSRGNNRILITSNVYGCSRMLEYTDTLTNIDFIADSLLWILNKENLLGIKKKNEK